MIGKGTIAHREALFLSEWVRPTFDEFLQTLGLRKFEQNVNGFSVVAMGGRPQLGSSHQRNSLFLH